MDFGKAFSFVFDDDEWLKKLVIGGIILLIPIVDFAILGWMLEIGRRVARGDAEVLPGWDDFGTYFVRGLKAFVVALVYVLPIIILEICPATLSVMGQNSDTMGTVASIVSLLVSCVVFIYSIFLAFVLPAALMRFTMANDSIGAGLAFGEAISMVKDHLNAYLIVFLGSLIAGIVAPLGTIACIVGIIFTYPYALALQGHLYGQAYAEASGGILSSGSTPPPPPAPDASADWTG